MDEATYAAMQARHLVLRARPHVVPAWLRRTAGEPRWQATLVVAVLVLLQARLPGDLATGMVMPPGLEDYGRWVLPGLQAVLGAVLLVANPRRVAHGSPRLRSVSLTLLAVASVANAWSAGSLVVTIVTGSPAMSAERVLVDGGTIWLTNILVFGLWYWELDRGGPAARARAERRHPDFVFPEMTNPDLADPDWEPYVADYLYVAFTNATAFSPTDTLPFSRWSKLAMTLQSSVSLAVGALVVARAVNALG